MNLQKQTLLILFFAFLLSGCVRTQAINPRVSVINRYLALSISISKVSSMINSGGFLEVQVTGMNQTEFYKKLAYKIEWLDQNGFVIPTILSSWTEFPAFENAEFRFKAIAPRTTATDFKILIDKRD